MKKRIAVGLVLVLVVLMALSTSGIISAKSVRTEVESLEYDCFTGFAEGGGVWQSGDIMHVRDILHSNINISEHKELTGVHSNVASGEINTVTGHTIIRGKSTWQPEDIDGAWVGHWVWLTTQDRNSGWGAFRGTGELRGKMLFTEVYDAFDAPERPGICDVFCAGADPDTCGFEGTVRSEGYILETGVKPFEQVPASIK